MSVVSRTSVLGLAVLLAAATAAADVVITANEVIHCWDVRPAGSDSVCFTLPRLELRTLSTFDIYEVRLTDSSRAAKLSTRLPLLKITLDSGQPVPPPAVRAEQLQQERVREARVSGVSGYAGGIDALPPSASQAEMATRCRDLNAALLQCDRDDDTVVQLLRDVNVEAEALRLAPRQPAMYLYPPCGCLLGMAIGTLIGWVTAPPTVNDPYNVFFSDSTLIVDASGCCFGGAAGGTAGLVTGVTLGMESHEGRLDGHRSRVYELIRRVNRAVGTTP